MTEQWIVGNWKMNGSRAMTATLLEGLAAGLGSTPAQVGVCPPHPYLALAAEKLAGGPILLGAQNVHPAADGAFTGEVSTGMLVDLGVQLCIVGHSERRQLFGETDAGVRDKLKALLAAGLRPILCVGETLEQREAGRETAVVAGQISGALEGLGAQDAAKLLVAYEPVWAIGTGKTATPEQAQTMHAAIRGLLARQYDDSLAAGLPLLYGGSVNPGNAGELLAQADINGALVGGAALKADAFLGIISHAR